MAGIYQNLDLQKQEIRLLHLLPSENLESPIQCQLVQAFLGDGPKYECLSYVWGRPDFTIAIELNGQRHFITPNLDLALRHIRLSAEIRILWVDALCINQTDVVERGQQVSLMRDIYQNCQVDLAWLFGPSEPEVVWPMPMQITDGLKLMREICKKDVQLVEGQEGWRPWSTHHEPYSRAYGMENTEADFVDGPNRRITWGQYQDSSDILPEAFQYPESSLLDEAFCYPPFWSRVWIVQELACSPGIILLAPNASLDWRAVSDYLGGGRYEEALDRSRTAISGHSPAPITLFGYIFEKAKTIEYQRSIVKEVSNGGSASLMDALIRFRMTSSTDPRDKVYALLGLVSEPHGIIPDYKKGKEQLFAEVSLTLIDTSATLDIICQNYWIGQRYERHYLGFGRYNLRFEPRPKSCADGSIPVPPHLPTWAADFSHQASSRHLREYFLFAQRSTFSAGKPFCRVPCKVRQGTALQLRGVAIGQLAEIHDEEANCSIFGYDQLQTWMEAVFGKSIGGASAQRYDATGETCFRAFWRTVAMDCSAYPIRRLREDELDLEEQKYRAILRQVCGPDYDLDSDGKVDGRPVSEEVFRRNAASWVFCVTTTGFYTMSLRGVTKPGDLILILDGGKVPVLVRPVAKGSPSEQDQYEIVHMVYAHGFMSGEVAKWIEEGRFEESEFLII